jgi:lipopolysaccharide biosynthesis regulator YciM
VWCFRQAVERSPQLAEAHLELGLVLRSKPQWRRDSKVALRQYLKLRPDGKDAARVRALLERGR